MRTSRDRATIRSVYRPALLVRPLLAIALAALCCPKVDAASATDRVIVKWREAGNGWVDDAAEARALRARSGRAVSLARPLGGGMSLLRLEEDTQDGQLDRTLAALRADPRVQFAEPDGRVRAHAYLPNDPLFAQQWYLQSTEIAAIRAAEAWDITRGGDASNSVVVAVIDSGVRFEHPDLRRAAEGGKLLPGYDFVSADNYEGRQVYATANDGDGWDPDPSDPGDFISAEELESGPFAGKGCGAEGSNSVPTGSSWHGTRVAGMIAAQSDNATGITGAGFNVRILPVRALGKCGGYDSDVIAAMYWAAGLPIPGALLVAVPPVNPTPAQVINLSLGGTGPCSPQYAEAVRAVTAHGVVVVVSAGNEGAAVDSPANCAGAVAVAGLRHVGTKVGYSNLGPEVSIAAPAGNCPDLDTGGCAYSLYSTTSLGLRDPGPPGYTGNQYPSNASIGTSFSAPLVAATAALMKTVNPALGAAAVAQRLRASARPFPTGTSTIPAPPACVSPSVDPLQEAECICNTQVCGAGMLDAAAAVAAALRPAAVARVTGIVGAGRVLTLDASGSAAAQGRSLANYSWSVVSATGGASTPKVSDSTQALASIDSPINGSLTLRLTVTDNTGAADSADVTITAAPGGGSSTSTSPPPAPATTGGGGASSGLWLVLLALLLSHSPRRRPAI